MRKIVICIELILINYISIVYSALIDPYILEYRIDEGFDNQQEMKPLQFKEKNLSLNLQPVEDDIWNVKIDFKEGVGEKINGRVYGNLDSKGHILEAQAKLEIEKKRYTLSTELAHLNQTPLMKKSLFGKVSFFFPPSSIFSFINHEGKINIGWLHLPSLFSRWTFGKEGVDLFGIGAKWYLYTKPYEITPDLLFKTELKLSLHLFGELPKKDYDEDILWAFSDFPIDYNLNLTKILSQKCHIEMGYQGETNPTFYIWGVPLSHGLVTKVDIKPTDTLGLQLMTYYPISIQKISYFNPNASFMSKEILGNLEFKGKNNLNYRLLLDYDYDKNQFEEVTFSINKIFSSLEGGIYWTANRNQILQHTLGIYLSNRKRTDHSRYNLMKYQEFPSQLFGEYQKENMQWLKGKGFEEIVSALNTPEKVSSYMAQFFQYHHENIVIPQTPRETFEKKMGDCDDQSRFASWVLTQHGYESYVLTYYSRKVAHGICVYKNHNGKWNAIEYGNIFYAQADNPEELMAKIEPNMLKSTLFKPNENYEVKSYLVSQTLEKIINWFWAD